MHATHVTNYGNWKNINLWCDWICYIFAVNALNSYISIYSRLKNNVPRSLWNTGSWIFGCSRKAQGSWTTELNRSAHLPSTLVIRTLLNCLLGFQSFILHSFLQLWLLWLDWLWNSWFGRLWGCSLFCLWWSSILRLGCVLGFGSLLGLGSWSLLGLSSFLGL